MGRKQRALVFVEAEDHQDNGESGQAGPSLEGDDIDDVAPNGNANMDVGHGGQDPDATGEEEIVIVEAKSKKRITISLSTQAQVVCTVCGQKGHTAGFRGAVYVDCPVKPCYLCKQPGHTTATCPYRMDPTLDVKPASGLNTNLATSVARRECAAGGRRALGAPYRKQRWRIETACMKLHSRRVTCLEFVPRSHNLVASCDKKGHVAVWDFDKVFERTLFDGVHRYQVNAMKFLTGGDGRQLLTASADGTAKLLDVETGMHIALCDMNPGGWVEGVSTEKSWCMLQSITAHASDANVAFSGDSFGQLHCLDLRAKDVQWTLRVHTNHSKVTSLDMHPHASHLLLSASNDYTCKLFDIRALSTRSPDAPGSSRRDAAAVPPPELLALTHPRVVSAAYFSPTTGNSVLTTCQDNRIRIWDHSAHLDQPASREMVHSHDFNRYLTPFRAVWDPKDLQERVFMIGRYISEDLGGVPVHPIDIIDGGTGALLEQCQDPNLELINPVNMPHPFLDVIVTGSSGHLFCWRPSDEDEEAEGQTEATAQEGVESDWALALPEGQRLSQGASTSANPTPPRGSRRFMFFDATAEKKRAKKQPAKSPATDKQKKKK